MLYVMANAIAELSPDLQPFDGESPGHFVVDMFHIAADPSEVIAMAAELRAT